MSLVSRHLEANGIPTVIIGTARDIVEHCGVARFLFVDFPLGNPCGEPYDDAQQRTIVGMALDLLESATGPRTTVEAPYVWPKGDEWKDRILTVAQPWKDPDSQAKWQATKDLYRKLRAEGKA